MVQLHCAPTWRGRGFAVAIYLLRLPNQEQLFPWEVGDRDARRYDTLDPENVRGCFYQADGNEDIWSALKRQTNWFVGNPAPLERATLAPGQCYPRIARPASSAAPSCGRGSFIHSLVLSDVVRGWTEEAPLVVREGGLVVETIERIGVGLP
jgi:hypothetical protein